MVAQEVITNFLEWLKGKLLFSLKMYDESFIKYNFSNLGTYKDTFFNFSLTQGRELFCKICKCGGFLVQGFTNCLNKPSLICKVSKTILSLFTSGLCMMLCLAVLYIEVIKTISSLSITFFMIRFCAHNSTSQAKIS